jgi:hypothetical protein
MKQNTLKNSVLEFNRDNHKFTLDGNRIPSVTQAIDEWHLIEMDGRSFYYNIFTHARVAKRVFEAARERGRGMHLAMFYLGPELGDITPYTYKTHETLRPMAKGLRPENPTHRKTDVLEEFSVRRHSGYHRDGPWEGNTSYHRPEIRGSRNDKGPDCGIWQII